MGLGTNAGIGYLAGRTITSWLVPNKNPWDRYREKIGWIAGSKPPGALSNDEIRSVVHSAPTIRADLATMNSARDSTTVQMTALKDNRAVVESVSNTLHMVNSNLRLLDAKARLSESIMALQGSTQQSEINTNWKKNMMGLAAERSIDEWEAKDEKIGQIGGVIGAAAGMAIGAGYGGGIGDWMREKATGIGGLFKGQLGSMGKLLPF